MKNKILVISGPSASGKSSLMNQIAANDSILIPGHRSTIEYPFIFESFEPGKTKYICFDDVRDFEVLEWVGAREALGRIDVVKKGKDRISVPTKDFKFIITTDITLERMKEMWGLSLAKHFNVIELRDCSMRMTLKPNTEEPCWIPASNQQTRFAAGGILNPGIFRGRSLFKENFFHGRDSFSFKHVVLGSSFNEVINRLGVEGHEAARPFGSVEFEELRKGLDKVSRDMAQFNREMRSFKQWADIFFSPDGLNVNSFVSRSKAYKDYAFHNPKNNLRPRRFVSMLRFDMLKRGWKFNPEHLCEKGGRIIRASKRMEYDGRNNTWKELPGAPISKEFFYIRIPKN